MIISCQFRNRTTNEYGGRAYSYICESPVKPGDFVTVATTRGEETVRVAEVNIPADTIDPAILKILKPIVGVVHPEEEREDARHE